MIANPRLRAQIRERETISVRQHYETGDLFPAKRSEEKRVLGPVYVARTYTVVAAGIAAIPAAVLLFLGWIPPSAFGFIVIVFAGLGVIPGGIGVVGHVRGRRNR